MADEVTEDKETLAKAHLPYRAEYCKTSRAKCKKCSEPMEANSLKLANMTKSRFHDGYDANFYHVTCFFQIKRPASVAEIRCFETLKFEDQKMLEKAIETDGLSVLGTVVPLSKSDGKSKVEKKAKNGKKRNDPESEAGTSLLVNYDDFLVEYAKSNRSKCVKCEEKIDKDTVRLGKLDYDAETAWQGGPVPRWYHVDCFVKNIEQLRFYGQVEKIKNFNDLEKHDRKLLKKKVIPPKPPVAPAEDAGSKKVKVDPALKEEEKLLKKQSDRFYSLREDVNKMKRKDIEEMLQHMRQKYHTKNSSLLIDAATDVLLFGPLNKCPKCKKRGGIELRGSSYICTNGEDWDKCNYETREPDRDVPDIPDEIMEKYLFLQDYEFTGGKRIFPSKFVKAVEQKEAEDNNIVQEGAPLEGLTIGVISWNGVKMDKVKVQKKITTLGGRVTTSLEKSLFVILSNEDELSKETSPKVEVAKALDVPFAKPDFLFKIESKEDVVPQLAKSLIGKWSGDLKNRFNESRKL